MDFFSFEFINFIFFIFLSVIFGLVLLFIPNLIIPKDLEFEKLSAYECGFDPFEETTREEFEVRFYLVAILFIIFDVEIMFLIPWALCLGQLGFFGFLTMMFFLIILLVGFVFEWSQGALDWE
jgi:NADH-quinone oxidoreductase subunit A